MIKLTILNAFILALSTISLGAHALLISIYY